MTDELVKLRELLAKATPGPWLVQPNDDTDMCVPIVADKLGGLVGGAFLWPTEIDAKDFARAEANAALIVSAVNALPGLLDTVERLQRELDEARGLILDLCDELEPYVEEKWGYDERLKRQYDRDMEPAVKGRAYLERTAHD